MTYKLIEDTLDAAVNSLNCSLDWFYPAYGRNGFNERNITYHFAKAFETGAFERGEKSCAFMEVPYYNKSIDKYNKRIDCVVLGQGTAIFIESKRLYSQEKAKEINEDIKRLNTDNIKEILDNLSTPSAPMPKYVYKLIIAETWQKNVVDWWIGGTTTITWDPDGFPENMWFSSKLVKEYEENNLYWLYGYEQIKV